MTESSKDTNEPTPKKRIEMPSSFKDTTSQGGGVIIVGIHSPALKPAPKPDEAPAKP